MNEILQQLINKASEGTLSQEEEAYLEFLIIELKYRPAEALSAGEKKLLEKYEEKLRASGKKLYSESEMEERTHRSYQKITTQYGIPQAREMRVTRRRFIAAVSGVAAVVALFFAVHFFIATQPATYYAANGKETHYLPDSTLVVLNKGSRLTLQRYYNRKNRKVKMSGEIFFDVTPNKEKPFIIEHGALTTQVKGTSFTINDYEQVNLQRITVNTGLVEVSLKGHLLEALTPNHQLTYDPISGTHAVCDVDAEGVARWMNGDIILRKAGMEELALRMQQHFGKELVVRDNAFGDRISITGDFAAGMQPEEIMESFVPIYGIRYEINSTSIVVYK